MITIHDPIVSSWKGFRMDDKLDITQYSTYFQDKLFMLKNELRKLDDISQMLHCYLENLLDDVDAQRDDDESSVNRIDQRVEEDCYMYVRALKLRLLYKFRSDILHEYYFELNTNLVNDYLQHDFDLLDKFVTCEIEHLEDVLPDEYFKL